MQLELLQYNETVNTFMNSLSFLSEIKLHLFNSQQQGKE